jgi:predicted metalloprotease with PDZ domain
MINKPSIHYSILPFSSSQHLFEVCIEISDNSIDELTFSLPAWIPGSYMIRDFAKNIGEISAKSIAGTALNLQKLDKQRWKLATGGKHCRVRYLVYAFDLSVRSAYLNDEYGFINGTSAFLKIEEISNANYTVSILNGDKNAFANWQIATSMPAESTDASGFGTYFVESYEQLIDFPILFGHFVKHKFEQSGIDFEMVYTGSAPIDTQRIATDLKPILKQHVDMFDSPPPVNKYLFITLVTDKGYGGLEHRDSTVLMFSRWDLPIIGDNTEKSQSYRDFLALCSHEFLHTWHVKRTRPKVLLSPDLKGEVYTDQLWIYEGFTSFYDDLALARSEAITPQQYLSILGKNITRVLRNPGRHKQSVAESSFDAWTRFYQQDANSINHIVSYYTKGGLIALCLDIYIREHSKYSLDDVMRALWEQHGKEETGTDDDSVAKIIAQFVPIEEQLNSWVYSPGELPLAEMLEKIGVGYHQRFTSNIKDTGGETSSSDDLISLGLNIAAQATGVSVTQVRQDSPACHAGIHVNDLLIAIDGWQITENNLYRLAASNRDKSMVDIHLLRDGRLLTTSFNLNSQTPDTCYLTIENEAKLRQWLGLSPIK